MTKTSKFKTRILSLLLAVLSVVTLIPATNAMAASADEITPRVIGGTGCGQFYAYNSNLNVYSDTACTNKIGTIYRYEGFSVIGVSQWYLEVEYSTSTGAKRGYIAKETPDEFILADSCVAKVNSTATLYYGASTTAHPTAGTVYANELVTVLAKNGDWVYVEYNSTAGRKRGYMLYSTLTCYDRPDSFPDLYSYNNAGTTHYYSGRHTVYAGPSKNYASVGYIQDEYVTIYADFDYHGFGEGTSWYIEYNVTVNGQILRKSGWIVFDD